MRRGLRLWVAIRGRRYRAKEGAGKEEKDAMAGNTEKEVEWRAVAP